MIPSTGKNVYFASDFHFGIPNRQHSRVREDLFVKWLDMIRQDAAAVYLMGDLFDFWFEYGSVIPKGYVRLLGKIAELTDQGIAVHLFRGNHDIWAFDYLREEVGIILHREPERTEILGRKFYLAHGDGLGPGDTGYKMLKKVFECRLCQWAFRWFHPDLGTRLGLYLSRKSRLANIAAEGRKESAPQLDDEMLVHYAKEMCRLYPEVEFFVFGHRHFPLLHRLDHGASLVLLGDWLVHFSYLAFDGEKMEIRYFS